MSWRWRVRDVPHWPIEAWRSGCVRAAGLGGAIRLAVTLAHLQLESSDKVMARPIALALPIFLVNQSLKASLAARWLEKEPMPPMRQGSEPVNGEHAWQRSASGTKTGVFGAGMGQRSDSHRAGTKPGSVGPSSFCYEMISVAAQVRAWAAKL